jgi:hypothetical protein
MAKKYEEEADIAYETYHNKEKEASKAREIILNREKHGGKKGLALLHTHVKNFVSDTNYKFTTKKLNEEEVEAKIQRDMDKIYI